MKKLALLFGFSVLTLTSCTKDDSPTPILLKTITNGNDVTALTYNGNKIVTVGDSETYTYTGDLITRKESKSGNNMSSVDYTYKNGKLISEVEKLNGGNGTDLKAASQKDYTYNDDGTVTAKIYRYQNGVPTVFGTSKITLENGNIVKIENFYPEGDSSGGAVYEYDNKINPLNNITGYSKLFDPNYSSKNNFTKSIETDSFGGALQTYTTTRVFTYNDKGYPATSQSTSFYSSGGTPATSNRVYTY